MTLFQQLEKLILTVAVIAIVAALIFTHRIDATSGLAYILGAAGLNLSGSLVGNKLGQPTAATGPTGSTVASPASGPEPPAAAPAARPAVPFGGPGTLP